MSFYSSLLAALLAAYPSCPSPSLVPTFIVVIQSQKWSSKPRGAKQAGYRSCGNLLTSSARLSFQLIRASGLSRSTFLIANLNNQSVDCGMRNKLHSQDKKMTSQENSSRPRRAGANYGSMMERNPLLSIPLSFKRKECIVEFKKGHEKGLGSDKWINKLFQFLSENDEQILIEDVKRWIVNHPWITEAGGKPPEALKMRNQEDPPSIPKKKASSASTSSSSSHQATASQIDKKVTFKTPEVEVHYISPRPIKITTVKKPAPKVKLPKPNLNI